MKRMIVSASTADLNKACFQNSIPASILNISKIAISRVILVNSFEINFKFTVTESEQRFTPFESSEEPENNLFYQEAVFDYFAEQNDPDFLLHNILDPQLLEPNFLQKLRVNNVPKYSQTLLDINVVMYNYFKSKYFNLLNCSTSLFNSSSAEAKSRHNLKLRTTTKNLFIKANCTLPTLFADLSQQLLQYADVSYNNENCFLLTFKPGVKGIEFDKNFLSLFSFSKGDSSSSSSLQLKPLSSVVFSTGPVYIDYFLNKIDSKTPFCLTNLPLHGEKTDYQIQKPVYSFFNQSAKNFTINIQVKDQWSNKVTSKTYLQIIFDVE